MSASDPLEISPFSNVFDFAIMKPFACDLIHYYMDGLGNTAGGSLHIVLLDGNTDEGSVAFCQKYAIEAGDSFGYFLAILLRHFSEDALEEMYKRGWR
ncbi:MAG: hypothetical protein WBO46_27280 [Caldilineaceae bacterium]